MQLGGPDEPEDEEPGPYDSETHIRVLELQESIDKEDSQLNVFKN